MPDPDAIKIAVVTGGGHGIGRAIARRLAADGVNVVIADLDAAAAKKVATELGCRAMFVDVGDHSAISRLIDGVENLDGPIDLFVSNAGVAFGDADSGAASKRGGIRRVDDRWETSWRVNVMAHVYAARELVPRMTERGGGFFVSIASAAGLLAQIGDAAYTATKHAAVAFAESLAITHGDDGIQVSVVCPQAVATRMIGIEDGDDREKGGFGGNDVDGILEPEAVADATIEGIREGRFLILPHTEVAEYVRRRAEDRDRWIEGMRKLRKKLA